VQVYKWLARARSIGADGAAGRPAGQWVSARCEGIHTLTASVAVGHVFKNIRATGCEGGREDWRIVMCIIVTSE